MTEFKYADFATWWDQQTDIDDDSEALARRIFKASRATDQAAPRDTTDEVIQYQHRYVGDPRQRGIWENSRNIDWAKRIWEKCENHIDPVNKWEVRALCLAASTLKEDGND